MKMLQAQELKVALEAEAGVVKAIDGLSLALEQGKTFALVGESGCGKSMTALALMRLLPDNGAITRGRVLLDEQDVLALPESRMRTVRGRRVGMIFQEPGTSLNPVLRVGEQMREAIETHTPLRGEAARQRAIDWLRRVGIPEPERRIDDYPFRLSGGQKQRVMIAMTLAAEPDFLLADEPTTALDVTIQAQILALLKDLQRERGLGMLLITHDLAVVAGMADTVALMYAGQMVEVAPAAQFFRSPQHPYAQALLRSLPQAALRGQPLQAVAGVVPPLWQAFQGCRFAERCGRCQPQCRDSAPALNAMEGQATAVRCHFPGAGADGKVTSAAVPTQPAADGAAAAGPLLDVRALNVRFELRSNALFGKPPVFHAVKDVSFQLQRGRTLALVGESGCGKTTTGKALAQLLRRQAACSGQALLQGQDLFALNGSDLLAARRQVQLIFQDPFASLNPRMRVAEILQEGVRALQVEPQAASPQALAELMARVGLRADALGRYPHEFSGGQRQRIAIARALAVKPALIVCDEPTSALDVSVQAQILNLLRELQRDTGVAYLFITHNIGVVEYLADEVAVMQAGRIVEQGPAQQVLQAPAQAYTRTLLQAVPRIAG